MMMLSSYVFIVAATCILAQNSTAPSAPPECARNCTTKFLATGAAGFCSGDDACFCQDALFWADITCCFKPYCTTEEETETDDYLVNYCRQIGSRSVPEIARRNPVGCAEIPSSIYAAATPTATGSAPSSTGEATLDLGGLSTLAETAIAVAVLIAAAIVLILFFQLRKRYLKRAMADAAKWPAPRPIAPAPPPGARFGNDIELPPYSQTDEGWGKDKSDAHSTMGSTMGEPVKPFEAV